MKIGCIIPSANICETYYNYSLATALRCELKGGKT